MNPILKFDSERPLDVIAMGRILIDFNPVDYYKPLYECTTFKKYIGGSPANIAAGLARLGKKMGFIGCVSDDKLGDYAYHYFKKLGIDTSCIFRARNGESMPLAFTEILPDQKSDLIMYRNHVADLALSVEMVSTDYIKSARMLVVSGTALAAGPSREAVLKALELARKNKTVVVFDIDHRPYTWKSKEEISLYYTLAARNADVIMGSREEYDLMDSLLYPPSDDLTTASRWLDTRGRILVIKHGRDGSSAFTREGSYHIKPFPVKALKNTGGGDGYGSAFLSGLLEGLEIIDCLEHGSASASMLVASHGCSENMPNTEELEAFIREKKEQYGEMIARQQP